MSPRKKKTRVTNKRKARTTGSAGGRKGSRLPTSISEHTKAVDKIGRKNVKRGSYLLGKSNFVTPTNRGFNPVRKIVNEIRNVKTPATFTYKLKIKLPNGEIKDLHPSGAANIIPRHTREKNLAIGIKKARGPKGQRKRTKLTHELFMERIRTEVFANRFKLTKEQSTAYKQIRMKSKTKARAYLDKLRQGKGISFQIEIYREI